MSIIGNITTANYASKVATQLRSFQDLTALAESGVVDKHRVALQRTDASSEFRKLQRTLATMLMHADVPDQAKRASEVAPGALRDAIAAAEGVARSGNASELAYDPKVFDTLGKQGAADAAAAGHGFFGARAAKESAPTDPAMQARIDALRQQAADARAQSQAASAEARANVDAFIGRTPPEGPTTWAAVKANIKSDFTEAYGPGLASAKARGAAVVDQAAGMVQEQATSAARRYVVGKLFGRSGGSE